MKRIALCIGNDAYSVLPALNCAILRTWILNGWRRRASLKAPSMIANSFSLPGMPCIWPCRNRFQAVSASLIVFSPCANRTSRKENPIYQARAKASSGTRNGSCMHRKI